MNTTNNCFTSPLVRLAAELEALDVLCRFLGASRKIALEIAQENLSKAHGKDVVSHLMGFVSRKRPIPACVTTDAVAKYLQERVEKVEEVEGQQEASVQASVLYYDFCEWFALRNLDVQSTPSQKRFGRLMGRFEKIKRGGLYYYVGIRLKEKRGGLVKY